MTKPMKPKKSTKKPAKKKATAKKNPQQTASQSTGQAAAAPQVQAEPEKKHVLVLRVNNPDNSSQNGFVYPEKGPVAAPDWDGKPECGGGLHGWEHAVGDATISSYLNIEGARWQVISVLDDPKNLIRLSGKVKFHKGEVLHTGDQGSALKFLTEKGGEKDGMIGAAIVRGSRGSAAAGDRGSAAAGDMGSAAAGYMGSAAAGQHGFAASSEEGAIGIAWWDGDNSKWCRKWGIIGETQDHSGQPLQPETFYKLNDERKFVPLSVRERIEIVRGDITEQEEFFDFIVNAANEKLLGGGGVDGAIHNAAGPDLLKACEKLGGCEPGQAKVTKGFKLRARFIAHAVGPRYKDGQSGEAALLASCYRTCIEIAAKHNAISIAFPSLSTGIFGYPLGEAAPIAIKALAEAINKVRVRLVRIVCFDDTTLRAYQQALGAL